MPTPVGSGRRCFHHRDFVAADLSTRKHAEGVTASVVVPARDEEATIATVVGALRRAGTELGLVDEIVVVDADSSDATATEAALAGARVVRQSEILPDAGTSSGKGEAMWKGLAASSGDLVVFVDGDLVDVDERFVVGLLGPLLTDPTIGLVKACYDRPFQVGDEHVPDGGGRVTELLARPVLSAFWPELNWLAQPLAGEYAARRELLESVPFVRGYGVELALLVDLVELVGVEAIAQVDLDRRTHSHQPLDALGRMAAEILHVAVGRLQVRGRLSVTDPLARVLLQPVRDPSGALQLRRHEVAPSERPPLRSWRAERSSR